MDVAAASFLQNGYAGTTMSGIAATLGGSKGTLWSHFPSKEELFAAVLDRATAVYRMQLTDIVQKVGNDLSMTLLQVCNSLLTKSTSPQAIALHRLVLAETGRFPEVGRIFYARGPLQIRTILANFLATAMERGQLRCDDPESAARAIMVLSMAGCHQEMLVGLIERAPCERIEADAAFAVKIFLRAYAA